MDGRHASSPAGFARGQLIGRKYEVLDILGVGGFGVVYLVNARESGSLYALKTFREEFLKDKGTRDMFLNEARLWIDLDRHPYLVRAHFVDELLGRLYIAMEYVAPHDGVHSLDDYLKRRLPSPVLALRWAIQFCRGMEYAYSRGVRCHRDIKPANILIGQDQSVKITDFGLAAALGASKILAEIELNVHGTVIGLSCFAGEGGGGAGTPTHMPPEQFVDAGACDHRSDVYSFGVVLYQMAAGRLPFLVPAPQNGTQEEAARFWKGMRKLHGEAPVPFADSPLLAAAKRCLEKDPARRPQNFKELRAELEPLLSSLGGGAVVSPEPAALQAWEWNNKGVSLNDVGRPAEAVACFEEALKLAPRDAVAMSNKALSLYALRRHAEALSAAETAIALNGEEPGGWNMKGCALMGLGKFSEAVECFERVFRLEPEHLGAANNKGMALQYLGRLEEAVVCFDRALSLEARSPASWNNKGVCLDRLGRGEDAAACYRKALELDPHQTLAWMNLGILHRKAGRPDEALRHYVKALEAEPGYPNAWYNRAVAEEELGQGPNAAASFRRFLELSPGPELSAQAARARARLAELEPDEPKGKPGREDATDHMIRQGKDVLDGGNPSEALHFLEKAIKADRGRPLAWLHRAAALLLLGRAKDAVLSLGKVLDLDPACAAAWSLKGDCLVGQKRGDEARRCYKEFLRLSEGKAGPEVEEVRRKLAELG